VESQNKNKPQFRLDSGLKLIEQLVGEQGACPGIGS
jgi:hypothetical protein